MLRPPAEFGHDPVGTSAKNRRIALTPLPPSHADVLSGELPRRLNDLTDGKALAQADVVRAHPSTVKLLQCKNMRLSDVQHVNVITQAGAIGSAVVLSVDGEGLPLARGSLQNEWNHMRLGIVPLTQFVGGAGGVEVAEGEHGPTVSAGVPQIGR